MNALTLPRRRLGRTELSIPVVPFGTQGFGNHFGHVADEDAVGLVRRAVELGVNHFDTARCYGDSMRKLALALEVLWTRSLMYFTSVDTYAFTAMLSAFLTGIGLGSYATQVYVKVDDAGNAAAVARAIDAHFDPDAFQTDTRPEQAFLAKALSEFEDVVDFSRLLGWVAGADFMVTS